MREPESQVISRPSLLHLFLKAAIIFGLIESATFGILIASYRISAQEIAAGPRPLDWIDQRIAGRDSTVYVALALSAAALILFGIWLVWSLASRSRRPLRAGPSGITVPGSAREIGYSEISAMVVWNEVAPGDAVIFDGLCVPEGNAPDTSLETVLLLDKLPARDAVAGIEPHNCDRNRVVRKLFRHPNNEEVLRNLAQKLTSANPSARVFTIAGKFARQRVVWKQSPQ